MSQKQLSTDQLTLQHFWQVGLLFKRNFYLSFFIPLSALLINTVAPFIVGKILASLLLPHQNINGYITAFLIAGSGAYLANRIGFIGFMTWQPYVTAHLQRECLEMLLQRGMAFHNDQVSGKLVSYAIDYPNAYNQLATTFFTNLVPFAVTIVSGIAIITYSSPLLGLLMSAMSVLAIGSGVAFRHKMAPYRARRIKSNKDVISHLADTIVNVQSVKTFAHEPYELISHEKFSDKLLQSRVHDWRKFALNGTNRIGGLLVFEFAFILLLVALVHRDPTLLAAGIFAFSYTVTLTNRLFDVGNILRMIEESLTLAEPITRAMQDIPEVIDAPAAKTLQVKSGAVNLKNVHFKYNDSTATDAVFNDLTLVIRPGEKVGLVGPSGGGKSTDTKLLLRFEDIQSGSIGIDDQDIAQVTQASLRAAIAYVPQESLLFHRSVEENISYGHVGATKAMIVNAAKDAYAHDFIMSLPEGYQTVVGERGVKLSGGQRQRIAIARAMLKDAPILLLDEATSALDSESEKVIQEALGELMRGRTALVIAHRLSTIQRMDRIIVLDKGRIVEDGSHEQLLERKGLYAKLWTHQSGGFIES